MTEEKKPKRKYTRRPKVEPMAVYAVMVTVRRGRKSETIYGESTRVENGCLVVVSMDGPPPLVEKVRYIPLGSAEIDVCQRPRMYRREVAEQEIPQFAMQHMVAQGQIPYPAPAGPQIQPGPLELARQRGAIPATPRPVQNMVERNADGVPVVTAGFMDGAPT
jgi:hypothetical protein